MYNIKIDELFSKLNIGRLIKEPSRIHGGLLHRMYRVDLDNSVYAVKALNPTIMKRPGVIDNYKMSEEIAGACKEMKLKAIVSKDYTGQLQELDGQYYLIYDWFDGESIYDEDLSLVHVEKIGAVLGKIHSMDLSRFATQKTPKELSCIEWETYSNHQDAVEKIWFSDFEHNKEYLTWLDKKIMKTSEITNQLTIISHRDLDPKNVLWKDETPFIIDWESAGPVNPMVELIELIFYWASNDDYSIHEDKVRAIIKGYKTYATVDSVIEQLIYGAFGNKLGWLEYSLKRSLGIEKCNEEEMLLGTKEAIETLNMILKQVDVIPHILEILKE